MRRSWPHVAIEHLASGGSVALVTVLATEGSAPREAGARMLAWPDGQWGTVGGGNLEHQVTRQARRMLELAEARAFAVQDYPLGPFLAQCCGGRVRLLIERLDSADLGWLADAARRLNAGEAFTVSGRLGARDRTVVAGAATPTVGDRPMTARGAKPDTGDRIALPEAAAGPRLLLFGAGHVGQALALALTPLPFRFSWFDVRPDVAAASGAAQASREALLDRAAEGAPFTLILTHDHALDYDLTLAALSASGGGWVGLIGSATKRARFTRRLLGDGVGPAEVARLSCPIGLTAIEGKAPEIIAVSVAADLLIRLQTPTPAVGLENALASL